MTVREIITQGLHVARTCRSLWIFGFFIGVGVFAGGGGSGRDGGAGQVAAGRSGDLARTGSPVVATLIVLAVAAIVVVLVMRCVSEGALIEGVVRARQGGRMTTRDAFRAGRRHWGVVLRIALLYLVATAGSVALLAMPPVLAIRALGRPWAILIVPAVAIAVPWLVTLYLVQAFAMRIAVIEDRRALDAMGKARLFLHGRLAHGLRLIVAMTVGTFGIGLAGVLVLAPVVIGLALLARALHATSVIVVGGAVLLIPAVCILAGIVGTYRSSVWTLAYVSRTES